MSEEYKLKFLVLIMITIILKVTLSATTSDNLHLSIRAISQSDFTLNEPFKIQCHLKRARPDDTTPVGSVFFFCPLSPDGSQFCLQNCINICEGNEDCKNKRKIDKITCRKIENLTDGTIMYEYSIPKLTQSWLNHDTYCKHRNSISEKVNLEDLSSEHHERENRDKEDLSKPANSLPGKGQAKEKDLLSLSLEGATGIDEKLTLPNIENVEAQLPAEGFPEVKSYQGKSPSTILKVPTELVVIIFITCLCLSILLNVFCCLRCVLIKQYSKNFNSARMQDFFCMKREIFLARHFQKTTNGIIDSYVTKHYPLITMQPNNAHITSATLPAVASTTTTTANMLQQQQSNNNFIYSCQKDLSSVPEYGIGQMVFYPEAMQCCSPRSENSSSNISNVCPHRHLSEAYNINNNNNNNGNHQKVSDSGISMNHNNITHYQHNNNLQFIQDVGLSEKSDTYIACKSFQDDCRNSKIYLVPKSVDCSLSRSTLRPEDSMTIKSDPNNCGQLFHQYPAASVEYSGVINQPIENHHQLLFMNSDELNNNTNSNTLSYPVKSSAYQCNESLQRKQKTNSLRGEVQSETLDRKSLLLNPMTNRSILPPPDDIQSSKSSILYIYSSNQTEQKLNDLKKNINPTTFNTCSNEN